MKESRRLVLKLLSQLRKGITLGEKWHVYFWDSIPWILFLLAFWMRDPDIDGITEVARENGRLLTGG